jgi:tetratricopeptide (TPR) repeat protein
VPIDDLLERADAARAAGRMQEAARLYDEAIARCRADGDLTRWTRAALGAASGYVFGAEPGRLPAQLYDVLVRTTDDADRARIAAALARCWVYAGKALRAVQFADEAVDRAQRVAQRVDAPELLADCLDAALAAHWGPDDLQTRVELAGQLDEVAAHVLDPDARLQAHLWGLQVACESLDVQAIHRHMRALERLGEESPRAQFFAAGRTGRPCRRLDGDRGHEGLRRRAGR